MKIAISGKGGVGKSTLAAALALLMARQGRKVLALDADPDSNLADCLGISREEQKRIIPISKQAALVEERTGAKVNQYGQVFKLNPEVSDIAERYAFMRDGVALLVLGAVDKGGGGCACPENVLIRALVTDLVLYNNEALVMDMEAGVEHLGRGTASGVDTLIVVIEPGQRSIETARRVIRMADEIGLKNIRFVANKVANAEDEQFIRDAFPENALLGVIPYSEEIRSADRTGMSVLDGLSKEMLAKFASILEELK
jgi:CO dehydrogenase maturation factor